MTFHFAVRRHSGQERCRLRLPLSASALAVRDTCRTSGRYGAAGAALPTPCPRHRWGRPAHQRNGESRASWATFFSWGLPFAVKLRIICNAARSSGFRLGDARSKRDCCPAQIYMRFSSLASGCLRLFQCRLALAPAFIQHEAEDLASPSLCPSPARGEGTASQRAQPTPSPLAGEGWGEGAFFLRPDSFVSAGGRKRPFAVNQTSGSCYLTPAASAGKCTVSRLIPQMQIYLTGFLKRGNRPETRKKSQKSARKTHHDSAFTIRALSMVATYTEGTLC